MSQLHDWALRWAVPYEALQELSATLGAVIVEPSPMAGKSEAAVQAAKRLQASNRGGRLWRNNLGAYLDEHGNFIRYGLCNDTPALKARPARGTGPRSLCDYTALPKEFGSAQPIARCGVLPVVVWRKVA